MNLASREVRQRFIDFFKKHEHVVVPSSSLVPEKHPSLLFTNSGMVQFTPYFLGQKDPQKDFGGRNLCSVQKCVRTGDLEIVGISPYHQTFFEMLGSWSIGESFAEQSKRQAQHTKPKAEWRASSYFKEKAVELAFDLITNKEYGYGIDPSKLIVTVFEGNDEAPLDRETINAWKKMGLSDKQISKLPASENWWAPAGPTGPGPCGPCTEVLLDRGDSYGPKEDIPGLTDNPRYLEFWNAGVFMQFNRDNQGKLHDLPAKSVDTGAGLERFCTIMQGVDSNYETDLFVPIINKIKELCSDINFDDPKIISSLHRAADHSKAITFMVADGVFPSNKDQGYVLRRIIRRAFNDLVWRLNIDPIDLLEAVSVVQEMYKETYPEVVNENVSNVVKDESTAYKKLADNTRTFINRNYLKKGVNDIKNPFDIYQTTGASEDLIKELAQELDVTVDFADFSQKLAEHQEKSRTESAGKFKGGLTANTDAQKKLHTATHLLQAVLREEFGTNLHQMGSNLTDDRLRFDFNFDRKLTEDELKSIELKVNDIIKKALPVKSVSLPKEEAEKSGALHLFNEKYGDIVNIYFVGEDLEHAISKEFCGGPHVENTRELGTFRIVKEEAVAKGVRRIKAIVN